MAPILSLPTTILPQLLSASKSDASAGEVTNSGSSAAAIAVRTNTAPGQIAGSVPAPFGDLLTEAVGQVDQLEKQARSAVEGLMSGRGVDVHEAMIATEKAEMGFELMLSLRNKALSAYQQIMGMQF